MDVKDVILCSSIRSRLSTSTMVEMQAIVDDGTAVPIMTLGFK